MSKQFWGIVVVVVLIFIGIFALTGKKTGNSNLNGSLTNHVQGVGANHVTLVEYGDYQCPYCGQYYPIIKQVQQEFNQQMVFQFRNYPLTSLHQNAFAASRAAEAAGLQNKFWQMHDLLYTENYLGQQNPNSSTWINASDPTTFFNQYAQQLGLNVNQFKTDYASSKVNDYINADMAAGSKLNVTGTPTFFLNNKKVSIGESVQQFEQVIKNQIAKNNGSPTNSSASSGATSQTKAK